MATASTNDVYYYWTSASTTTTTSESIWTGWAASTSTTTTATSDCIFYSWADPAPTPQATYNNLQARSRGAVAAESSRYAKMRTQRDAAEEKAQQLLMDLIGPDQLDIYKKTGRLYVRGDHHDYILKKGGLVKQVGKKEVVDMCVHLKNRTKYPETDNLVGLKLMIEGGEEAKVIELANFRPTTAKPRENVELPQAACLP